MASKEPPKQDFVQSCLVAHNKYRAMHGCPALKLNKGMCTYANAWAQNLAKRDTMEHRPKNNYGENIYFAIGVQVTGEIAVQAWYNEIAKYDFDKSEFSPETGHFTQLIWKATTEVGIAIVKKKDKTWVVANYKSPGNVVGTFKENVPKKK